MIEDGIWHFAAAAARADVPWAINGLRLWWRHHHFQAWSSYAIALRQIAVTKTEPGDENNQDISCLVGKVDIRKLETFEQNDPDAYSYSGGLNRANQGVLEFVEMFKAPIKMLHPLLTATQEGNYNGSEISARSLSPVSSSRIPTGCD